MVAERKQTILAVDDHEDALYALERILAHHGYLVFTASSGQEALERAKKEAPDLILLDVMMPLLDGLQLTRMIKKDPVLKFTPVILVTAKDSLEDITSGLENGADGYITKPFKPEELLARTKAALRTRALYEELRSAEENNRSLLKQLSFRYDWENIIGQSEPMKKVYALMEKVARSDSPVLITGESGTGKELVARAVHYKSSRRKFPFVAKNCAAFNDALLESQLFGHVKGAFTGAIRDQQGLFEAADRGTLFLDEIGEMSPHLQAKLLRVLQEGSFMPVGTTEERRVNVRVLAATNRDLPQMCSEGKFREDLYYRLNVIEIKLPPLHERQEDVPLLIDHFLKSVAERRQEQPKSMSGEAVSILTRYQWRGNVRELENEIERMLILAGAEEILAADCVSQHILDYVKLQTENNQEAERQGSLKAAVEELEREMIRQVLEKNGWNKSSAAKELGISRSNLIAKVHQYGLE